ncbi:MAG TPA: transglycosylase domain-containing protein [Jatrophihabitantaceae bacterium]
MARPNTAETLLKLVGLIGACAVLCAGVLLPYVGGLGLVAGRQANKFLNTTCNLRETPPAQKTTLYAKDGTTQLATLYTYDRELVPSLNDVPKYLQQALVATEDRRFYSHHGVDMRGLLRSAVSSSGGDTQGGSTLTMQYVKQVRYYQADTDAEREAAITQTLSRKMEDAKCALDIEKKESKNEILLNYLNIAFFGENSYGIGTAAKNYFGVPVDKLTLPQAALLVGVVKAPTAYDPFVPANRQASIDRRNQVIQNLADVHDITQAQADEYKKAGLSLATTTQQTITQGCAGANQRVPNAGFFCDYVKQWLADHDGIGDKQISTGGYRIVTTLDPNIQSSVQTSLWSQIPAKSKTTAVMPVVDPHTGNILALATSKRYGLTNDGGHTTLPIVTDSSAGAGSTYKLFTMLAALNVGMPTTTQLSADEDMHYNTQHCPSFSAENDSEGTGFTRNETLQSAIQKSSNTYFVGLEDNLFQDCELSPYVNMAQSLGISSLNAKDPRDKTHKHTYAQTIIDQQQATFTLGFQPTSPLDLAGAYATLANDGTYCAPSPIISLKNASGQDLDVKRSPCTPKLSPQVARTALQVLTTDTHPGGTSAAAFQALYGANPNLSIAGKTGTVNATGTNGKALQTNADLWFAGVTPDLTAVTALFNVDNPNKPISGIPNMTDDQAGHLDGAFAAQVWSTALTPLLQARTWAWPDPNQIPNAVPIQSVVGQQFDAAKTTLTQAGYKVLRTPFDCGSSQVYGNVAYQSANGVAAPGSTIELCVSDGTNFPVYTPPVVHKPTPPARGGRPPRTTGQPPTTPGPGGGGGRRTPPPRH